MPLLVNKTHIFHHAIGDCLLGSGIMMVHSQTNKL
jgi:hypothetical protein